ncbi:MAG: YigZ family protein [Christensenella sp.]
MSADEPYLCLAEAVEHEIVIKKSRFICALFPINNEADAQAALTGVKKHHYNATHNCSAMILGARRDIKKSADDGEPQGTAGAPMSEVLARNNITNILAVVTRYFGGTLLGAGGLVRAYGGSVAEAVAIAKTEWHIPAAVLKCETAYADYGKLENIAAEYGAQLTSEFGEKVTARMVVCKSRLGALEKRFTEAFAGAHIYEKDGEDIIIEPAK